MNAKYNKELTDIIALKKKEWTENLKAIPPLLRSQAENMVDANALSLSYRVMLKEDMHYFLGLMAEHDKELKELRKNKFIFYATGMLPDGSRPTGASGHHPLLGKKLTKTEYDTVISGDLNEPEFTIQVIGDMIDFLKESIKTIDQILYSIKNRLDLFNYLK